MVKNLKYKRIFISGASGVGKTTLAKEISKVFNVPFISTSAKKLWPRYGFIDHRDAIRKSISDKQTCIKYQWDVLYDRRNSLKGEPEFVTDRSPFDNYIYFMNQGGFLFTQDQCGKYARGCRISLELGDIVIFLRFTDDIIIEDDKYRIVNWDFQKMMDGLIETVIKRNMIYHKTMGIPVFEINTWDFEKKMGQVKNILLGIKESSRWIEAFKKLRL